MGFYQAGASSQWNESPIVICSIHMARVWRSICSRTNQNAVSLLSSPKASCSVCSDFFGKKNESRGIQHIGISWYWESISLSVFYLARGWTQEWKRKPSFFFLSLFRASLQHMEVPRLGGCSQWPYHSYSNSGSELHLWPKPQLTAMPDPQFTARGQDSNPKPHGY